MSGPKRDRLYNLLPAVYRMADARHGKPLRALLRPIEEEMNALQRDIDGLYNDWFIETCSDWVIPYIGDLFGIERMQYLTDGWNLRSYVANALSYRRRKGTATVLEKVAHDVTGWPAHSLEFFRLTAATQCLQHLRPGCLHSPHLRDMRQMDSLEGPFGKIPHTADVRKIKTGQGRYNITNIGIFLWRLSSYSVQGVNACCIDEGCYTFDPVGNDLPLFNQPKSDGAEKLATDESDIAGPISRSLLCRELRECQQSQDGPEFNSTVTSPYFSSPPVISIKLNLEKATENGVHSSELQDVSFRDLMICDLSLWKEAAQNSRREWKIAVDPELGRLMISDNMLASLQKNSQKVTSVLTDYSYGFFGDIGAGPYDRNSAIRELIEGKIGWQAGVAGDKVEVKGIAVFSTLKEALVGWNNYVKTGSQPGDDTDEGDQHCTKRKIGIIAIMDSRTYHEDVIIRIPEGSLLLIVAATFMPSDESTAENGRISLRMLRPHIRGNMNIYGTAKKESENPGEIAINGLLLEGDLNVREGNLGSLIVGNSTIVPGKGAIRVYSQDEEKNDWLELALNRSICGRIELHRSVPKLLITECIIDSQSFDNLAINAEGTQANIAESTIIGKSRVASLAAVDCIFTGLLSVRQTQVGNARFCYLPSGSKTPQSFECQPDAYLERESDRIHPAFNSLRYPDPAYAQLSASCPIEISAGAEDGSEMGAFKSIHQPQRLANLNAVLEEYLPIELEAGIFFMS